MENSILSTTSILRITDYDRTTQFYLDGLRFEIDWEWRHEPGFPVLRLNLKLLRPIESFGC